MYYPQAIRNSGSSSSSSSKVDPVSLGTDKALLKLFLQLTSLRLRAKPPEDTKKAANSTKEVAHDAALPPVAPKDSLKEKDASQSMEIVLATLPIPLEEELQGKGQASTTYATA